ncbi:MAG: [alpha-L-fucopyranosyl-(1-_3)-alpha-L-rhamnopyran osyl-(1-_3)-2-O-methyl-alpha-L-rhamnopyranosyl] dimycocerosyl phenol-phthiocerol 2'''-O-methyltransferase [Desulfobulbaceae bacterium]
MKLRKRFTDIVEYLAGFPAFRKEVRAFGKLGYICHRRRIFNEWGVDLVLDVGANAGQFAEGIRKFYPGMIISFEPIPFIYEDLEKASSGDPDWHVCNYALGRQTAVQKLNVSKDTSFSSFLETNEYCDVRFGKDAVKTEDVEVTIRSLQDVLPELVPDIRQRRVFLKMDTQGYDLEVFKGLGELKDSVVALQSEISILPIYNEMPRWVESIHYYEMAGFSVAGLFPVTLDQCRVVEFDCLMVRKQH